MMTESAYYTLKLTPDAVSFIDQRVLPQQVNYIEVDTVAELIDAIKTMLVRGAPAIGVAGAYGVVLSARTHLGLPLAEAKKAITQDALMIREARPTAVNLMWAVDRMLNVIHHCTAGDTPALLNSLEQEATLIADEDVAMCTAMANNGKGLFAKGARIMTCCNTGPLATAGGGTALGVVIAAYQQDPTITVLPCETRPRLQGLKLTTWELQQAGVPFTLVTDNAAAWIMKQGKVDAVITGADRISRYGDVANKIGTYALALHCKAHDIPFYVAAPSSTIDLTIFEPDQIEIEERHSEEITHIEDVLVAPKGIEVHNPAFDVTPKSLVTAIITEHGVHHLPVDFESILTSQRPELATSIVAPGVR